MEDFMITLSITSGPFLMTWALYVFCNRMRS